LARSRELKNSSKSLGFGDEFGASAKQRRLADYGKIIANIVNRFPPLRMTQTSASPATDSAQKVPFSRSTDVLPGRTCHAEARGGNVRIGKIHQPRASGGVAPHIPAQSAGEWSRN
jgi:hypothetical protein